MILTAVLDSSVLKLSSTRRYANFSLLSCILVASCGGGGGGSSPISSVGGGGGSSSGGGEPPDYFGMFTHFEEGYAGGTRNATAYTLSSSRLWYANKDFISLSSVNQTWAFTAASYEPEAGNAYVSEMRRYRAFYGLSSSDDSVNFRHLFYFDEEESNTILCQGSALTN